MPKLIYALMCADLLIDKESSSTSFIRTIEHAVVPEMPSVLPRSTSQACGTSKETTTSRSPCHCRSPRPTETPSPSAFRKSRPPAPCFTK